MYRGRRFLILFTGSMGCVYCLFFSLEGMRGESMGALCGALFLRGGEATRGHIIKIQNHKMSYKPTVPLCKRVWGLPGDEVLREGETLCVEGKCFSLLSQTSDGRDLSPFEGEIPMGFLFVAGEGPRSFDSRYREFGLVSLEEVWGRAIYTW